MGIPIQVLIIDAVKLTVDLVRDELQRGNFEPHIACVETLPAFQEALSNAKWDVVLSDYCLPECDALSALSDLQARGLDIPFILLVDSVTPERAAEAMRIGVRDYILKAELSRLCPAVYRELSDARFRAERRTMQEELYRVYEELERRIDERTEDLRLTNEQLRNEMQERSQRQIELEAITATMAAGVTRCSRDLRYLWASAAYGEWVGWRPEEIAGRPIVEVIGEKGLSDIRPYVERVLAGERVAYETQIHVIGTGPRWIRAVYTPTYDATGVVDGWVAVVADITDRKQMEDALRESETKLRAFFENMQESASVYQVVRNEVGQVIDVEWVEANPVVMRLLGRTREEVIGKRLSEVVGPERHSDMVARVEKVLRTGEPINYERTFKDRFLLVSQFRMNENSVATVNLDITELKQTEEALRRRAEEIERLLDALPSMVWIAHDPECLRITGNRLANELLEVSPHTNVSQTALQRGIGSTPVIQLSAEGRMLRPEELPIQRAISTGLPVRDIEIDMRLPSGKRVWIIGNALPLFNTDGSVRGAVSAFQDITDLKKAQEALLISNQTLELRVRERTAQLDQINEKLRQEINERNLIADELRKRSMELEQERSTLERKNVAMREILAQVQVEKDRLKTQLTTNIEHAVSPVLHQLKAMRNPGVKRLASMLESDLREAAGPFLTKLRNQFSSLSPREMEICRHIRSGMATKEIAEVLNLSPQTVQKHRETIRKKLGLSNEGVNLQVFLRQLTDIKES